MAMALTTSGKSEFYKIIQIFNRWGQVLYESQPYDAWDGTYKGKDMPLGTYYYIIDLNDGGSTQTLSGAITIIR